MKIDLKNENDIVLNMLTMQDEGTHRIWLNLNALQVESCFKCVAIVHQNV